MKQPIRDKAAELSRHQEEAADWFAKQHSNNPDDAGFARWRLADPQNGRAYSEFEQLYEGTAELAEDPDILAALGDIPQAPVAAPSPTQPIWYRFAAAAAVFFISILTLLFIQELPTQQQYMTAIGERRVVLLSDGSEVTLDAATRLHVTMSSAQRDIQLIQGRARFDVAKETDRPFTVQSGIGSIRALGTIFDVDKRHQRVHVALIEGVLEVAAKSSGEKTILNSGQKTSMSRQSGIDEIAKLTSNTAGDWTSGQLQFDATTLGEAIIEINRYLEVPLKIDDEKVAVLKVTGTFDTGTEKEIIKALSLMFELKAVNTGAFIVLKRRD